MSQITKSMLEEFRQDFKKAMQPLNEKYNLELKIGSITFDDFHFTSKLEGKTKDQTVLKSQEENFNRILKAYGANFVIGDKIKSQNKLFTIAGFNPRASKQPVEIVDDQGNKYKCSIESANKFIVKQPVIKK